MLVNRSVDPFTARLPLGHTLSSKDRDSYYYRNHSRLNSTSVSKGMPPHERLPGVNQLLTPASPTSYGRSQHYRPQDQSYGSSSAKSSSHRSSLPLEDILCSADSSKPSYSSRPYKISPPSSKGSSASASHYYSPISQANGLPSRSALPSSHALAARSGSFSHGMSMHHQQHGIPGFNDIYQYQSQQRPRRGSVESSRTSGISGASSIPPPSQARLLGEQHFPGEGLCWVYDDGTHIQKEIDGEAVNPQWGVTKAGKPRKRLAQACLTCREKKIKCDLADPKCLQCDKSGRECRYASARASRRPGT